MVVKGKQERNNKPQRSHTAICEPISHPDPAQPQHEKNEWLWPHPEQDKCDSVLPDPCAEIPPLTCHPQKCFANSSSWVPERAGYGESTSMTVFWGNKRWHRPTGWQEISHPWLPLAYQWSRDQHRQQLTFPVRTVNFGLQGSTAIGVVDHCGISKDPAASRRIPVPEARRRL